MSSIELAARRGVSHCLKLLKNHHFTSAEVIEDTKNNENRNIQLAGQQLEQLRAHLRNDVVIFLQSGKKTGVLDNISEDKIAYLIEESHMHFADSLPEPRVPVPTLDMTGIRIESSRESGRIQTPRTPVVSDIPSFEDIEVVEVSDSSAVDSQILDTVADHVVKKMTERNEIPTVSARQRWMGIPRSDNIEFSKLPTSFIPSSCLRTIPIKSCEASVQTQGPVMEERVDAATSYNSQHYQDIGESSTSENSDPSIGQIEQSRVLPQKVIAVNIDGSTLQPREASMEPSWKPPLELVRIAERDISSSFGSEIGAKWESSSSLQMSGSCGIESSSWSYKNKRAAKGEAYEPTYHEHWANTISHGIGILPSIIVFYYMAQEAYRDLQYHLVILYGIFTTLLFFMSTCYHYHELRFRHLNQKRKVRYYLHICDRAAIYLFIAASYTPWLCLRHCGFTGLNLKVLVWVFAILGILYQYNFHERYKTLETIIYILIATCPSIGILTMNDRTGVDLMMYGGVVYLIGVIFFKMDGIIPFAHAIWHLFVLLGASIHTYAVYSFLLGPDPNNPMPLV